MLVVAEIYLHAQSVLFPKCAIRQTVPLLGSWVQVSSATHVFITVVTFKQNLLSVSQDDMTLVDSCGDKSSAIFLLVLGWLFSHYFQLPSLGLALY